MIILQKDCGVISIYLDEQRKSFASETMKGLKGPEVTDQSLLGNFVKGTKAFDTSTVTETFSSPIALLELSNAMW